MDFHRVSNSAIQCNRTSRIASPSSYPPPSPPQDPTAATSLAYSLSNATVICNANSAVSLDDKTHPALAACSSASSSPNSERSAYKRAYTVSALLDLPQYVTTPLSTKDNQRKYSQFAYNNYQSMKDASSDLCEEMSNKRAKSDRSDKMITRLLNLQENFSKLRCSNYTAVDSMLDLLTRPCAIDRASDYTTTEQSTNSGLGAVEQLNLDIAYTVEYAKSFDVFMKMPLEDKCFLLRDVTLVILLFENAYQSFLKKDSSAPVLITIINSDSDDSTSIVKRITSLLQLATESLIRVELDRTEYVLLKAIVFLHAECFGLSSKTYKQLVESRQLVLDALFDYMMSTYGKQGPVKYGNVLSVSWTLFKTAQRYKEMVEKLHVSALSEEILSSTMPNRLI